MRASVVQKGVLFLVPSLFVIQGRNRGARYELPLGEPAVGEAANATPVGIGRETGNLVRLDDHEVSRRHAELRREGDGFLLADLGSSNGTFVDDRRIERAVLKGGERIQIGRTVLLFREVTTDVSDVDQVNILPSAAISDASRIVRSMPDEDSHEFPILAPDDTHDRWLSRARGNLQVMYRTALAVSHTLDIDELLGRILELVFEWIGADRGCVMLIDPESGEIRVKSRRDRVGGGAGVSMGISRTILDYVLERREGVHTSDAQEDDRFAEGNSVMRRGVREAICVPMQGRYHTVGVLYVDTLVPSTSDPTAQGTRFGDDHLKLMMAVGHQAALAVEDTMYYSAMVQAERLAAIGQTIAAVSHHIKNILQGIRGGGSIVEMGLDDRDLAMVRKGWDIVMRNQNKISSLVLDMLSFSKERRPMLVPTPLGEVVMDVVETVRKRAEEAGLLITTDIPSDLPDLRLDAEGLSHALLNVVTNSLDAIEEKRSSVETTVETGHVVIRAMLDHSTGRARLTVVDNGCGIPADTLQRIFNVFVSTKGAKGTGLGLTVSRKILREHGGDITAESRIGEGSTFVLEFPLVEAGTTAFGSMS
ncbi:MAG: ATP-binding protein [Planctomycetaceae bacterium]